MPWGTLRAGEKVSSVGAYGSQARGVPPAPRFTPPKSCRWTRLRPQRARQFLRIENRRLASEARTHDRKRSSAAQRRKTWDRLRQSRWQVLRDSLIGVQPQNRCPKAKRTHRGLIQLRGHLIVADDHHLCLRLAEVDHRQPVSRRKNTVLSRDPGID